MSAYHINVTIHVLAALIWVGGMFFLAIVGAPVLRKVQPTELRSRLFTELGGRFRTVGWIAIAVLIVTGIGNLYFRGMLNAATLGSSTFWSLPYGRTLAWKLVAVAVLLVFSVAHDFIVGPAAGRAEPGSPEALRLRRVAALLARGGALVALIVIIVAVRLARGG